MTLQELLKAQGLTEEQVTAILSAMKESKIYTASEENLDTRYNKLKGERETLTNKYGEATKLIETLKSSGKGNQDLQEKITIYETKIEELQSENEALKTDNALKFALKDAGAVDVDYLVFKAKEKGEIKLDEDGRIKGIDNLISGLKTQLPAMFETSKNQQQNNNNRRIIENNLPDGQKGKTVTKDQFLAMGYNERMNLKEENPELFKKLNAH